MRASECGRWRKAGVLLAEKSAASPHTHTKNASLGFVSTDQGVCVCDRESKHRR